MDDTDDALLSIGAFARRVGLAPSALRFYDDCGVLRPASVDEATGYRYYAPSQERRAVLIRRVRAAGLPLTDAGSVLDGTRDEARAVLERHAAQARETATAAQAAAEEILRELDDAPAGATARVGGAELASAVRQVAPSAATGATREEFPVLGFVLLELDGEEVRLVATDRYRLAVRTLRPYATSGAPCRVLADTEALNDLATWALPASEVQLVIDAQGAAALHADGEARTLRTVEATYPDYRLILDDLPPTHHRVITDRNALRALLTEPAEGGPVTFRTEEGRLHLSGTHLPPTTQPALCTGQPLQIAFDPAVLLPALDAGVGPDVLLEVSSATQPVVVRSADQGSFTTLVMPVHDATTEP